MILKHRKVSGLFTTPKLLEALAEKVDIYEPASAECSAAARRCSAIRAFHRRGSPRGTHRFYPTYGNTLMGLAASVPLKPEDNFSVTYYAPQPRAVLRVVDPNETTKTVDYDTWGRVELTTLTKEFFMPRFLERDEALRRKPRAPYAWTASPKSVHSARWRNDRRRRLLTQPLRATP